MSRHALPPSRQVPTKTEIPSDPVAHDFALLLRPRFDLMLGFTLVVSGLLTMLAFTIGAFLQSCHARFHPSLLLEAL